jgi:hypothetical protein
MRPRPERHLRRASAEAPVQLHCWIDVSKRRDPARQVRNDQGQERRFCSATHAEVRYLLAAPLRRHPERDICDTADRPWR